MMKKRIFMLAAVAVTVFSLSACKKAPVSSEQYDALNAMFDASYSEIKLTVKDTFDEDTWLKSEYTIKYSNTEITVEYAVEQFTELSLDSPITDFKTTLAGTAVIKNGAIDSIEGDNVGLTANIATVKLHFAKDYFKNFFLMDDFLTTDVKNASAFLGAQIDCSDMKVTAAFLEVFSRIDITFKSSSGNTVQYAYVFTV